jgi:hypothetical protein
MRELTRRRDPGSQHARHRPPKPDSSRLVQVLRGGVRILKLVAECKWIYWRQCRLNALPDPRRKGSQRGWRLQDRGCNWPPARVFVLPQFPSTCPAEQL